METAFFTPRTLAARWAVTRPMVINLVKTGQLPAIDVALTRKPGRRRPTYRILPAAVEQFEQTRMVANQAANQTTKAVRARRGAKARFYP